MGWRSEVADGWRLFLPIAREVVSPRRLRFLIALQAVLALGTAAGVYAAAADLPESFRVGESLAAAICAASIGSWIALARWRPSLDEKTKWGVYSAMEPGALAMIRQAQAEGRPPKLPDSQLHEAADRAVLTRRLLSRSMLTILPAAGVFVSYIVGAVMALVGLPGHPFGVLGGLFAAGFTATRGPSTLRLLGQTSAIIAARPEGERPPPPPPARPRTPYRQLGTDHPTDYDR